MKKLIILLTVGLGAALLLAVVFYASQTTIELVSAQEAVEIPFLEEWQSSGHADASAEAFVHWNEESPAEVPVTCAKCHSTPGYQDFIGADGSAAGEVDAAAPIGTVVECTACHNNATLTMDSVVMPSGIEITNLGDESRCMQCHQGRASTVTVDESIAKANLTDVDTVSPDLGFTNIHYYAAAASKYGTLAKGGYQYEGKSYDGNFAHVEAFDTCIECHDSHTLEVKLEACQGCHEGVASVDDLKNVRMQGSLVDYDGDGDTEEGIYFELEGLQTTLYQAIQIYAIEKSQAPIAYDSATHPYFFLDTNKNGQADPDEANGDNRYNAWTARLAKAAYNYQMSLKDPGAFAHGGKYIIQLLYDSVEDLNAGLSKPIDLSQANRIDDGHFAGSEEAFRHWDEDGMVEAGCAKCHSAEGLPTFLENEANIAVTPSNGLQCSTCHNDVTTFSRYEVSEVKFPSGATLSFGEAVDDNLCLNCHQGRESTVSVNRLIEGLDPDQGNEKLRFLNVHYFAAGATLFGGEAQGAYEYEGKTYVGRNEHVEEAATCTQCHSTHGLEVQVQLCADCHDGVETEEDLRAIRESGDDFDGDGDTDEGLAGEIDTMREALYAAVQDYAETEAGAALVYNPQSYPYFFADANGNGEADDGEGAYSAWTPRLLQAAYNYQYSSKDPGAFAHNGLYILQVVYDSLEDLGADVSGMTRP
ncbi:MAG: hypothetical protein DPW09_12930 [Anaerolineae bacterium]|nr:hypothetical protein [Anaerolineales bacterium]MCQ3974344.1 hypothetical protein [Anaerolineae bacterium]